MYCTDLIVSTYLYLALGSIPYIKVRHSNHFRTETTMYASATKIIGISQKFMFRR